MSKSQVYERIETLIPEILNKAQKQQLDNQTAIQKIQENPGIIPVFIDSIDGRTIVFWADVKDYRFVEWKFRNSIAEATSKQAEVESFSTDISFLASDNIFNNFNNPTGFIFQMSRCGSTLLGKALARSNQNLSISEPSPLHEGLWKYITDDWDWNFTITEEKLTIIKNLILGMGRLRWSQQQRYFIKFRSWNSVFFDIIKQAFPDVPCLFMYRQPEEVLNSANRTEPFGYTRFQGTKAADLIVKDSCGETAKIDRLEYCVKIYESIFSAILKSQADNVVYLNYELLIRSNFEDILSRAFSYYPSQTELEIMQEQFDYYSKDDSNVKRYKDQIDIEENNFVSNLDDTVTNHLRELYKQLENSDNNFKSILLKK